MSQNSEKRFRAFASFVLSGISKLLFRTRRHVYELPAGGSLIFCNHTSIWDFANLCYALRPVSNVHFVATGIQFDKSKLWNWLLRNLGVIRKTQGAVDVMCVKEIIKAIRAGDSVAIYAAGMTSYDGREGWPVMNGTGNLAKLLKCPVYSVVTEGGVISRPRYTTHIFRGHTDITVRRICTAGNMTADDFQKEINEALRFNDWDWQEQNHVRFSRMKDMQGVERTLFRCPACGTNGHTKTSRGKIFCTECGFTATRDKYGFFHSDNPACPHRMDEWADQEIAEVQSLVDSRSLHFEEKASYEGEAGVISMDMEGISFVSPTRSLRWTYSEFQFLIMNDEKYLTFHTGSTRHMFTFENKALMYRWFFAHRCIVNSASGKNAIQE